VLHEKLWDKLKGVDCEQIARWAACQGRHSPERCILKLVNTDYVIDIDNRKIYIPNEDEKNDTGYLEQLCLLAYLINAKKSGLAGKLVKAVSLPGGAFFFRGPHELPTAKLVNAFGDAPELLKEAGVSLGGKVRDYGDGAIELFVLPKVPMIFVIWKGDDEFEARSSILFDKNAVEQLPLDALWCASKVAAKALIEAGKVL
jgi:hypothetical protein